MDSKGFINNIRERQIKSDKEFMLDSLAGGIDRLQKAFPRYGSFLMEFVQNADDVELKKLLRFAKAFLFAAVDEEFGIAPVEAMGFGLPVIAYSSGGLKETVKNNINGFLYEELTIDSLAQQVKKLENLSDNLYLDMREAAYRESKKYSEENFKKNILNYLQKVT